MRANRWRPLSKEEKLLAQLYRDKFEGYKSYAISIMLSMFGEEVPLDKAEEAVQDAFVIAWEKRKQLRTCEKPANWVYGILKNVIRNMAREQVNAEKILRRFGWEYEMEWQQNLDQGMQEKLWMLMMDEEQREDLKLLVRLVIIGDSYKELSRELNISVNALGMRIYRAKQRLREYLSDT